MGPPHLQRRPARAHHTQEEVHQRNSPVPLHPSPKISCAATEPAARAPFRTPPPLGFSPLGNKNSSERRFSRTSAAPARVLPPEFQSLRPAVTHPTTSLTSIFAFILALGVYRTKPGLNAYFAHAAFFLRADYEQINARALTTGAADIFMNDTFGSVHVLKAEV